MLREAQRAGFDIDKDAEEIPVPNQRTIYDASGNPMEFKESTLGHRRKTHRVCSIRLRELTGPARGFDARVSMRMKRSTRRCHWDTLLRASESAQDPSETRKTMPTPAPVQPSPRTSSRRRS
ncbi:unnamed protein product [Haemonchus placei]|uniref:Penicillin-binding protein 2 n=1 Tax=Haemonchus placei TaxID=6290 RepID=A0A0N4W8Z0_HAEPC|nr:unnamed protein product [Haemonchus placei]